MLIEPLSLENDITIDQVAIDTRQLQVSDSPLFVALKGTTSDGHNYLTEAAQKGAKYALVDAAKLQDLPHLPTLTYLPVASPLQALQKIAHLHRKSKPAKVLAITGSYGKTLLKDLLQKILSSEDLITSPESFNSQIGVALSLLKIKSHHKLAIIEAGISLVGEMDHLANMIEPDYAVLTTIGKAHLSTLGSKENIASEKAKLIAKAKEWSLIPPDSLIPQNIHPKSYVCGKEPHLPIAQYQHSNICKEMPYELVFPNGRKYQGKVSRGYTYTLDLIQQAASIAHLLGTPVEKIETALSAYLPEPMRIEMWQSPRGITFINEPYGSDPLSVIRALRPLKEVPGSKRKIFVFGGLRHTQDNKEMQTIGSLIASSNIDMLILQGNNEWTSLLEVVQNKAPHIKTILCQDENKLVKTMESTLHHDDVVLLKGPQKELVTKIATSFEDSISDNKFIVNLSAIQSNLEAFRAKLPNTRIMVMVKALGYGTSSVILAPFLAQCGIDIVGVAYADEGIALKREGIKQDIFLINAATYEAKKIVKWGFEVAVSNLDLATSLSQEAVKENKVIKVHLHIDTGMSRLGCRPEEALALAKAITNLPGLKLEGIMTHFASADIPEEDAFTQGQADKLRLALKQLQENHINPPWRHAANSAGAMRFDFADFNMVRVGLSIFGLHPSKATEEKMDMQLAVTLVSKIVGINVCKKGETISYNRTYLVKNDEARIAVLPLGYFDGIHRSYSGKGYVIIRGKKAPLVGLICMDYMMCDITDIPEATLEDPVLIFGKDEYGHTLAPEEFASWGGSNVYELVTCLGPRIQRIFVQEEVLSSEF